MIVKALAEMALLRLGPAAISRRRRSGRTLILAYHGVIPRGEPAFGDAALHIPQDEFGRHLDVLQDDVEVVSLAAAVAEPIGRSSRPRVAVTFDDGYAGALEVGMEEVERRRIPATVFISPGLLGGVTFWWDAVARHAPPGWRAHALREGRGDPETVRRLAARAGLPWAEMPSYARSATQPQLRRALARPGIDLALHGWMHRNLQAATAAELDEELRRPLQWSARLPYGALPFVAYPYGASDPRVHVAAESAGYEAGFGISGGWLPDGTNAPLTFPRLNVASGLSPTGLRLRLAGLLGA